MPLHPGYESPEQHFATGTSVSEGDITDPPRRTLAVGSGPL